MLPAAVYALPLVLPLWLASLLVGIALAITGGALVLSAQKAWRKIDLVPEKTVQNVKESVQGAKERIK